MTQLQKVKYHLENYGSISPLEAQSNYNIWRLAAVIYDVKKRGNDIGSTRRTAPSGSRYAVYSLAG